jgi:hypothetical protein
MHAQQISATERILDFVNLNPGCLMEEVVLGCPDLSWNQVLVEVDRLSRNGQIRLRRHGMSGYALSLPGYERVEA